MFHNVFIPKLAQAHLESLSKLVSIINHPVIAVAARIHLLVSIYEVMYFDVIASGNLAHMVNSPKLSL